MKREERRKRYGRSERGLSLLEYAAGAAVLISVVYVAMTAFSDGMSNFFNSLGNWASKKGNEIVNSNVN
ncbi:MAG: hypothetical protein KDD53_00055 [Bdellovibrionales bacterium]|nr:hypothetical protein [Bdellovibrionales bacterium]